MIIRLFNTLTKSEEEFHPLDQSNIRMYVCGPTVYDKPHIGNARSVVAYDVLYRLLRYIYNTENVTYVRNITDVDDKINIAAKEKKISISDLTKDITKIFHENMDSLNCLRPNIEPKATEHIDKMIEIIEILLSKNIAYIAENKNIYFNIDKCFDYGILAGREIGELRAGARIAIESSKINPEDFVLWKPESENDDPSSLFDSPWGRGRPGWHIECSAMSSKYLGNDFDIHGGGADLMFPHHTNEIAQSCSAFPNSQFAKYWVHNGFVTVGNEKMSKSLGNFITVDDLLKGDLHGEIIRYVLLATNYQKPLDWNAKNISDAKKILDSWYKVIQDQNFKHIQPIEDSEILEALADNLNTSKAFSYIINVVRNINKTLDPNEKINLLGKLKFATDLLGFLQDLNWFKEDNIINDEIQKIIEQRQEARRNKNWHLSDQLRETLKDFGVIIEDNADGSYNIRKNYL